MRWYEVVGWISLGFGFLSALIILIDVFVPGHRQKMWIMNLVYPISALYWGPPGVWFYFRYGRRNSQPQDALRPQHIAAAVSHCGAGCTLGDITGEWIVWAMGPRMLGAPGTLGPEYIFDFPLAWIFGIVFQYFTIVPMRSNAGGIKGLWLAIRADTLSILSFQLGLFGWMALSHLVIWRPPLHINTAAHWWMMQVGMVAGFFTAWPVNRFLIQRGWKEKM